MIEDKDKIKDLFSSKLKDFEPEVPASVWGGLDQLLSQQPAPADASSASSSSSSSGSVIKTVLIAIGVAAAIVVALLLMPESEDISDERPVAVVEEVVPDVVEKKIDTTAVIIPAKEHKPTMAQVRKGEKEPVIVPDKDEPKKEPASEPKPRPQKEPFVEKEEKVTKRTYGKMLLPEEKAEVDGFSLSTSGNAGLLAYSESQNGSGLLFSREVRSAAFNSALDKENKESKLQHRLPVSLGVRVSKGIAPNLSLETGVVYTYLSSKVTSESAYGIEENQNFHYLGVPLSLNYKFYELGKTKFYLSVGAMVQKDIKGRYESKMAMSKADIKDDIIANILYYKEPYYIKESIKQSNPQFSVNASVGVAYPIYKKLYLYGTVGGAYYFDAGNKYHTIYSDRKTQLDLNLGIKFDF